MISKVSSSVFLLCALSCACASAVDGTNDINRLIRRLPTNSSSRPGEADVMKLLASFGDQAIPALQKELRLGIKFNELNELLKNDQSNRGSIVRVLAMIQTDRSTDLLVRTLADPCDNYAMRVTVLDALAKRKLTENQVLLLLRNHEPEIALVGLTRATKYLKSDDVKQEVERIFDPEEANRQFHNEYGHLVANEDQLWQVRLSAGKVLGRDMVPEMKSRAETLIAVLKTETTQPSSPDKAEKLSHASATELAICRALQKLSELGEPVKDLVQDEAKQASGNYAKVLSMALLRMGDRTQADAVADELVNSDNHSIRYCAALTLRIARERTALPALRKALRDPYQREDGSCVRPKDDNMVYPVRIIVADALIDLGEDPKTVRQLENMP